MEKGIRLTGKQEASVLEAIRCRAELEGLKRIEEEADPIRFHKGILAGIAARKKDLKAEYAKATEDLPAKVYANLEEMFNYIF